MSGEDQAYIKFHRQIVISCQIKKMNRWPNGKDIKAFHLHAFHLLHLYYYLYLVKIKRPSLIKDFQIYIYLVKLSAHLS
jgi:hypothetical protein